MKELIIDALDKAILLLDKQTPQTRRDVVTIEISDVNPFELLEFMKKNNVPDTAYFDSTFDDTAVFGRNNEPCLRYPIDVPTTDKEKLKFRKNRFSTIAFRFVYDSLTANGFKRVGFNSGLLREFDDTTVYEMYIDKNWERLVKYYSLPFTKAV